MDERTLQELATLARLREPMDGAKMVGEIDALLQHFAMLQDVSTDGVEPSAYPIAIPNRPRADRVEEPLAQDDVLANAPAERGGCFLVPRVVEG